MNTTTHTGRICKGDTRVCTDYGTCPACKAARKAVNDGYVAAQGGPADCSVRLLPGPHFFGRDGGQS